MAFVFSNIEGFCDFIEKDEANAKAEPSESRASEPCRGNQGVRAKQRTRVHLIPAPYNGDGRTRASAHSQPRE